jgi:hypothetical protein
LKQTPPYGGILSYGGILFLLVIVSGMDYVPHKRRVKFCGKKDSFQKISRGDLFTIFFWWLPSAQTLDLCQKKTLFQSNDLLSTESLGPISSEREQQKSRKASFQEKNS